MAQAPNWERTLGGGGAAVTSRAEPFAPPGPRPWAPETPSRSNPEPVVLQGLLQPGT